MLRSSDPSQDESFREAFTQHYGALHRYAHRRIGAGLADEIAAETFATAYRNWSRFDSSRPVQPWLFGIAANLIRHHYRDEERMLRAYARAAPAAAAKQQDDEIAERLDARADARALAVALASLRREERDVVLLHAWAELSDDEIAVALSLPLGTVKSRLSRARSRIRNSITTCGQPEARPS